MYHSICTSADRVLNSRTRALTYSPGNVVNKGMTGQFYYLIIYMKKFLNFVWLRAVQFFSKTVQKRVNSVQKEETNQVF